MNKLLIEVARRTRASEGSLSPYGKGLFKAPPPRQEPTDVVDDAWMERYEARCRLREEAIENGWDE
jgi:hypothetical protein